MSFGQRVELALADPILKIAVERTAGTAEAKRAAAVAAFPAFEDARARAAAIKDHTIANLGHYLEQFEANAIAAGAQVHWAQTADEAAKIVVDLCRKAGAKSVARSKSMLGEEIGLPHALAEAGIERIETDLAEHIIQLAGERPSHIVWPAMHKTREQVSELFRAKHADPHVEESIAAMAESARRHLRVGMLGADVGISGANFLIADTGSICTVTNEGNAELSIVPPRVHIVTAGIEKLVPSMPHAIHMLRMLARSATGAALTQYTSFYTGPKRGDDRDGPAEMHIVLVDNGRSAMRDDAALKDMLRCIRCGACMNHCVVFRQVGGHAYGGTYPGPMGAVLTPALDGLSANRDLAHACTMNGRCQEVCPVNIPLPTLLRGWREKSWREGLEPVTMRQGLGWWRRLVLRPRLYRLASAAAVQSMRLLAKRGWIARLPLAGAWTAHRDMPAPEGGTFMAQYARGKRR
ncbi:(Fe-S)-binding protein [Sphingomonas sp. Leaf407]|uniref:lactate utilization protein B n=1 Tax=unclassified Sphingomonas TaxID=196159 RepID=UPI0006F23629|nr:MULTISPECIES: lactate utilization protein B [unclassified Sphingomonas]KQN37051.1 (Fe-S)-binding protein [Sphingomonas sp. Leaf42]KQT30478.1 (Fe-S)-binding protein [Sphingomonas sp. Leaf407]